ELDDFGDAEVAKASGGHLYCGRSGGLPGFAAGADEFDNLVDALGHWGLLLSVQMDSAGLYFIRGGLSPHAGGRTCPLLLPRLLFGRYVPPSLSQRAPFRPTRQAGKTVGHPQTTGLRRHRMAPSPECGGSARSLERRPRLGPAASAPPV